MPFNVKITVPSRVNRPDGTSRVDAELQRQIIRVVHRRFAHWFGGCTGHVAQGNWIDSNNNLVSEVVWVVESYHGLNGGVRERVRKLAKYIARQMNQECVAVVFDEVMELVYNGKYNEPLPREDEAEFSLP
jgi:hypothetical protein